MEINGLPLHPLVVHAAVVFPPLAALAGLLYAGLAGWRDRLRWPMVALAVVAVGTVVTAYLTGRQFLEDQPALRTLPAVADHQDQAGRLLWVAIGFGVVALVAGWLHHRSGSLRLVLGGLLALASVALLVATFLTGEAGARAVWGA